MIVKYNLIKTEKNCKARLGHIETNYGEYDTPMFMPVGTLATVKTLSPEELKELNSRFDCFVTGSDQVWACDLNFYDDSYFLSFVDEEHKKISYAASFGRTIDMMKPEEKAFIAPQLMRFDKLSVREDSGTDVVNALSGREDAVAVLDPTFLLNQEEWEKVASHDHRGKGKKYILCYLMQSRNNDAEALRFAKKMSKQTGLPIIKICRGLTSILWGETLYVPTVEEWLGLFMDAEYVVTNSFHGMAFSVNFQKNFTSFVEGEPASGRNSRIYDRCKDLGLLDRIHVVGTGSEPSSEIIDYTKPVQELERYRAASINYLRGALED